jgi:hypothetical protein
VSGDPRIFPRRYHAGEGNRYLIIGLTGDETSEFERLDRLMPLDHQGNFAWDFEGEAKTPEEQRWFELYRKHEAAWSAWLDPQKLSSSGALSALT